MITFFSKIYLKLKFLKIGFPISPMLILDQMMKNQFRDRDEMEKYQLRKINELIQDAKINTVFYKEGKYNSSYNYRNLRDFQDNFPKLTKQKIINNSKNLINRNIRRRITHSTSGSTGNPMKVEISLLASAYRLASVMRFYSWWGVKFYDKSVLIWGEKKNINKPSFSLPDRVKKGLKNRLDINVFDLNNQSIFKYFQDIERFKPKYIRGYKSGLYSLAKLMDENNLHFDETKIKVAIVTSEILFENERNYIENILNCPVANEYGAAECGLYGAECPEGSMHINEEGIYITIDDENNAIVIELNNNAMPLINYFNDDRIYISDEYCKCGRTSRIIEKVEGRVNDVIKCPDGSEKSQYIFYYIVKELDDAGFKDSIFQYKITQNKNRFLIEIIPATNFSDDVSDYLKKRMYKEIGKEIEIEVKLVSEIKRDKSGKLRFFVREK